MAYKEPHYISYNGDTSADMGWYIKVGGRSIETPAEREMVIEDIPFRKNPIDLASTLGRRYFYGRRKMTYTFIRPVDNANSIYKSIALFSNWLMGCRNMDLYDSIETATFKDAKCSKVSYSDDGKVATVTAEFTANPYKVVGGVEVL